MKGVKPIGHRYCEFRTSGRIRPNFPRFPTADRAGTAILAGFI